MNKKKLALLQSSKRSNKIQKKIRKAPKNIPIEEDEEIDSEFLNSDQEEEVKQTNFNLEDSEENEKKMETADEKRIKLAKKILQDTKKNFQKNDIQDDFFARDKGIQLMDEEVKINQALQNQILGKQSMLFTELADRVSNTYNEKGEFTTEYYKGHTQCITSVQFEPYGKQLYTVSKDRSIIQWDIETKKKTFITLGKNQNDHSGPILCSSLNYDGKILATSGLDKTIKLWDTTSNKLITTLKSHRAPIYTIKFGLNSNNLCSASCDRTFKLWDVAERAYIETFFGHQSEVNDMDAVSEDAFLTCGFDRQAILWKTKHGSQLIFNGHDYSIDCIRSVTPDFFVTGSQDSSISLWALGKKKPIYTKVAAHGENHWITGLGSIHNSDLIVSGSYNQQLNFYKFNADKKNLSDLFTIPSKGIVNGLFFSPNQQFLASIESDEHRLGRWITSKAKNQVMVHKLF